MSRFGFMPEEAIAIIQQAIAMPGIFLNGIYSHLAQAANADLAFSLEQEATFANVLDALKKNLFIFPINIYPIAPVPRHSVMQQPI